MCHAASPEKWPAAHVTAIHMAPQNPDVTVVNCTCAAVLRPTPG